MCVSEVFTLTLSTFLKPAFKQHVWWLT
jgi:hypothetical protein